MEVLKLLSFECLTVYGVVIQRGSFDSYFIREDLLVLVTMICVQNTN